LIPRIIQRKSQRLSNSRENDMEREPDDAAIPRAADPNTAHDELVEVFDTQQESEAMVVRGLLESAGIDALTSSLDAPQDVLPGVGGVILRVRADQAEEAKRMIEEYRVSGPMAPDEPEPEPPLSEDSAA